MKAEIGKIYTSKINGKQFKLEEIKAVEGYPHKNEICKLRHLKTNKVYEVGTKHFEHLLFE